MSAIFWSLLVVNAAFAGLMTLALPHGPNFVYALMAGSQLGMLGMLGWKWRPPPGNGPIR